MISKKEFLAYKLEMERRFHEQDIKILELQNQLEKAELRRQIRSPAPVAISDEEKKANEEEAARQQKRFAEWTEDADTLSRLGMNLNGNA